MELQNIEAESCMPVGISSQPESRSAGKSDLNVAAATHFMMVNRQTVMSSADPSSRGSNRDTGDLEDCDASTWQIMAYHLRHGKHSSFAHWRSGGMEQGPVCPRMPMS